MNSLRFDQAWSSIFSSHAFARKFEAQIQIHGGKSTESAKAFKVLVQFIEWYSSSLFHIQIDSGTRFYFGININFCTLEPMFLNRNTKLLIFNCVSQTQFFNVCTVDNPYIEFISSQGQTLICELFDNYLTDVINANRNHT